MTPDPRVRHHAAEIDASPAYHLAELAMARSGAAWDLPLVPRNARVILDVGCGAGQTLRSLDVGPEVTRVGVDVDEDALRILEQRPGDPALAAAAGEMLPIATASCDLVISRVALPYMWLRAGLTEMARVLRPGGSLWITLHPRAFVLSMLRNDLRRHNWRGVAYRCFVLANGFLFSALGLQMSYPLKRTRRETYQTRAGMAREMRRLHLDVVETIAQGEYLVIHSQRSAAPAGSLAVDSTAAR